MRWFSALTCACLWGISFGGSGDDVGVPAWVIQLADGLASEAGVDINKLTPWDQLQLAAKGTHQVAAVCDRGIDFLHLFSGEDNPGKAMQKRGYTTKNFDIRNDKSQNFVQLPGLLYAGILEAGIVPGGALLAGPDCSSWVWMSRGSSWRSRACNVWGRDDTKFVYDGNATALYMSVCLNIFNEACFARSTLHEVTLMTLIMKLVSWSQN